MWNLSTPVLVFCLFILTGLLIVNFVFATEKIDINTAPLEGLVKLIHIGEIRALELISLRPFSSLDDLARIKGISELRIEDIKKQGLAWIRNEEQIEIKKKIENNLDEKETKELASQPEKELKKGLASVSNQIPEKPSFFPLLIAFLLAIFSGIIILFLKKKLKTNNRNL